MNKSAQIFVEQSSFCTKNTIRHDLTLEAFIFSKLDDCNIFTNSIRQQQFIQNETKKMENIAPLLRSLCVKDKDLLRYEPSRHLSSSRNGLLTSQTWNKLPNELFTHIFHFTPIILIYYSFMFHVLCKAF